MLSLCFPCPVGDTVTSPLAPLSSHLGDGKESCLSYFPLRGAWQPDCPRGGKHRRNRHACFTDGEKEGQTGDTTRSPAC